jgi:hypothetical protein
VYASGCLIMRILNQTRPQKSARFRISAQLQMPSEASINLFLQQLAKDFEFKDTELLSMSSFVTLLFDGNFTNTVFTSDVTQQRNYSGTLSSPEFSAPKTFYPLATARH